jgi:hypothetical protein
MDDSELIRTRTPESRALLDRVQGGHPALLQAQRVLHGQGGSIQRVFEELIGKPVGDSFTLLPAF